MWVHSGRLPHVLPPAAYHEPAIYARELEMLFERSWHCVGTLDALRSPGDFITVELLEQPVLVRNCDGELRAFQNVCAHRHSILVSEPRGTSARIRCQYHGWEYDADGRTCRVPDARSFRPIERGGEGLRRFRAASCGQLVFVSLAEHGADLREELGERTWELVEERFSTSHGETAAWTIEHAANWKIVVENSLEGYHLPVVHPRSLRKLSAEASSTHIMDPRFSTLENTVPPGGAAMSWVAQQWSSAPQRGYCHHLAYPSLMLALTDLSSMAQIVVPTSPRTSRSLVFSFVHRGDGRWLPRVLAPIVGRVVNRFTRQVQGEDNSMFPKIQRGMRSSEHAGAIGAREERVHAFQRYVERITGGA